MKRVLLLIMLALGTCGSWQAMAQNQDENKSFVHCIVLDKTKSMIGKDGTPQGTTNIWKDVQDYCCEMIDGFSPFSKVVFYTFDRELFGPDEFEITEDADKTVIKNRVKAVTPDGQHTWIASNLEEVIKNVYKKYRNNNVMVYLLTDGIEEQYPSRIKQVIENYEGFVGDYDHLYYVDLRGSLKNSTTSTAREFKDAFKNGEHADIIENFAKIVSLAPGHRKLYYEIKEGEGDVKKFRVTQTFNVVSGNLTKDFSFEATIPDGAVKGINFTISPSKLSVSNLTPLGEGNYSVVFEIEKIDNVSLFDCKIPVQLKGCTGENTLSIDPSSFDVELRKEPDKIRDTIIVTDTLVKTVTDTVIIEPKDKEKKVTVKSNKFGKKNKTKE